MLLFPDKNSHAGNQPAAVCAVHRAGAHHPPHLLCLGTQHIPTDTFDVRWRVVWAQQSVHSEHCASLYNGFCTILLYANFLSNMLLCSCAYQQFSRKSLLLLALLLQFSTVLSANLLPSTSMLSTCMPFLVILTSALVADASSFSPA